MSTGPRGGNARALQAERVARPPFLAICLAGRTPTRPLRCCVSMPHARVSAGNLMLVFSDQERRTLAELFSLQSSLRAKKRVRVGDETPHVDMVKDDDTEPEPTPREPYFPDFVAKQKAKPCGVSKRLSSRWALSMRRTGRGSV